MSLDSADFLEQCVGLAECFDATGREELERATVGLAMRVATRDRKLHLLMDQFVADAEQYATEQQSVERRPPLSARLYEALTGLAMAGCVATVQPGCGGETDSNDNRPVAGGAGVANGGNASGGMVYDALPMTGGRSTGGSNLGGMVYDALPMTGGRSTGGSNFGGMVDDPLPVTGGRSAGGSSGYGGADTVPVTGGRAIGGTLASNEVQTGHFRDTQTRRTIRTKELPLYDPPDASLRAVRDGESIRVCVVGVTEPANTLWESDGDTEGEGLEVLWAPKNLDDQLRVAIRTHGGVTVVAIRARELLEIS